MTTNTAVDVMVNGGRPIIVAAVLVDPVSGEPAGASPASAVTVVPQMSAGGHLALTTSATSGAFVAFASQTCKQLTVFNNTGTVLEAQQGGSGVAVPLFIGQAFTFFGLTNASQIGLRRVDQSATTVTAQARWEA